MVSAQRVLASNGNVPVVTPPYTNEFVKRSNEITENIVKAVSINNQLTVNAIDAAAESFRTLNRTIDSVTEYNTSAKMLGIHLPQLNNNRSSTNSNFFLCPFFCI